MAGKVSPLEGKIWGQKVGDLFTGFDCQNVVLGSMNNNGLNMWYSFNFGLVHFIAFSSEVFFAASNNVQERMLTWLKKDLEQSGYNLSIFDSLYDTNLEIKDIEYAYSLETP